MLIDIFFIEISNSNFDEDLRHFVSNVTYVFTIHNQTFKIFISILSYSYHFTVHWYRLICY